MLPHIEYTDPGFLLNLDNTYLSLSDKTPCLIYQATENDINRILSSLVGDLADKSSNRNSDLTLQTILGNPIEEVRLDWQIDAKRRWSLPGLINIILPKNSRVTLALQLNDLGQPVSFLIALTVLKDAEIGIKTNFAWGREDYRELQNNRAQNLSKQPLPFATLTLTAKKETTIQLLEMSLIRAELPNLLKQHDGGIIPPIDPTNNESLCLPIDKDKFTALDGDNWSARLAFAKDEYTLPFLYSDDPDFPYHIKLKITDDFTFDFDQNELTVSANINLKIGSIELESFVTLDFNWETMAFQVEHDRGIELFYSKEALSPSSFLGLDWTVVGAKRANGQYHFFTLETKDNNYGIALAKGANVYLSYTGISEDPIIFRTTAFKVSADGLWLETKVESGAVKLFGLDTKFTFKDSGLTIIRNQIQSFTLAGSGPLPPDLVGEAIASIWLNFVRRADGTLTLVSGKAELQKDQLLDCKNTRFQFTVNHLGLEFVNDGKFHLYFTITGKARFVLAPEDDLDGPLSLLPDIEIDLKECPLTGDMSVIGQHVDFLIAFPKPVSFNFLGAFELELRAIGFFPQAKVFDGDPAMQLTGQLKFAQGIGDVQNTQPDYHKLFIGLPGEGETFPRIHFASLAVDIKMGDAFHLAGSVTFYDSETEEGFKGDGLVRIQGLPIIEASFGFMRVRQDTKATWKRAWFIYAQLGELALMIPVIQIYIREIGLGFGYRFTLVSIKAADEADDVKSLIKELAELSKSQGDLAKQDRWAVDLEKPGEDVRWTIVFRTLIAQNAAGYPYVASVEKTLPSMFLFDVVAAFRSDFTFFMAGRGWINTNYYDFRENPAIRTKPFVSGFLLLSPRQKRFLVHVRSNPDGHLGSNPELPEFVKIALGSVKFSATLLIEPNLLHYELGWPNMLRWDAKIGPLKVSIVGGFIFRLSTAEFAIGTNFRAEGELEIDAGFDAGAFGVSIYAYARVAYGARYIGVIDFVDATDSVFYGGIGLELQLKIRIRFWIEAVLAKINFRFSAEIHITAALEVAISVRHGPGLMGRAQIRLSAMGHGIDFTVSLEAGKEALDHARKRTARILAMGLEATDVEGLPGLAEVVDETESASAEKGLSAPEPFGTKGPKTVVIEQIGKSGPVFPTETLIPLSQPHYSALVLREQPDGYCYFVLMPQSEMDSGQPGFLPAPPLYNLNKSDLTDQEIEESIEADFKLRFVDQTPFELQQFSPGSGSETNSWQTYNITTDAAEIVWKANWGAEVLEVVNTNKVANTDVSQPELFAMRDYFAKAFIRAGQGRNKKNTEYYSPYFPTFEGPPLRDERVLNPTESAYEAAVIGAVEQFRGSPHFKQDPNLEYDRCLKEAFELSRSIYGSHDESQSAPTPDQIANQVRGLIIQDLISDLQDFLKETDEEKRNAFAQQSIAFQMGLVFRVPTADRPGWLDEIDNNDSQNPRIYQRLGIDYKDNSLQVADRFVRPFNVNNTDFHTNPPQFENIQVLTDSYTIAINWDLAWPDQPASGCSRCQADPDHHLMHYRVTRRSLNSLEPEKTFTVKSGYVLHRGEDEEGDPVFNRLLPRFQIVDHFDEETVDERINLPATGKSYAYTITPIDFSQSIGRSLTVVGTRYPDAPPLVPVDGELLVTYRLTHEQTAMPSTETAELPSLIHPHHIRVHWTEPTEVGAKQGVPIAGYRLIFRPENIIPVGSYGLDGKVQGDPTKRLPSTNARPRPTDIKVSLDARGSHRSRYAEIPLSILQEAGVFPSDAAPQWRPQAWRVYIQSISTGDVPSALAPVSLVLRFENSAGQMGDDGLTLKEQEERQPAVLEWLPSPVNLPILPPEDGITEVGDAHFPMPSIANPKFGVFEGESSTQINYQPHPFGLRAVRLRWNQGPSQFPDAPLTLNAGYQLWELDVDAHTTNTFKEPQRLQQALRHLQEVQMVPDEDLWLIPGDTLNPVQWEAWYPSHVARQYQLRETKSAVSGSENPLTPWYSWRESLLHWPKRLPSYMDIDLAVIKEKDQLSREAQQNQENEYWHKPYFLTNNHIHAYLVRLIEILETTGTPKLYVDLQAPPPFSMANLDAFWQKTLPEIDRYGWKALQLMGLSLTFSLREEATSRLLTGDEMMQRLQMAVELLVTSTAPDAISNQRKEDWGSYAKHLHVELLVKGSEAIRLGQEPLSSHDTLLALVQVSLRPIPIQRQVYEQITFEGDAGTSLRLELSHPLPFTIVDLTNPGRGEIHVPAKEKTAYTLTLPPEKKATLLIRRYLTDKKKVTLKVAYIIPEGMTIQQKDKDALNNHTSKAFVVKDNPPRVELNLNKSPHEVNKDALAAKFPALFNIHIHPLIPMMPTNPLSLNFSVPAGQIIGMQSEQDDFDGIDDKYLTEWELLQAYFSNTLKRYRTEDPIALRILTRWAENEAPARETERKQVFSNFILWSQRFFDHGPSQVALYDEESEAEIGPWLATAYAKQSTPTYVTPDKAGRLTYYHLLNDRWGHAYRYYIDPFSRYDRLWQAIHKSPTLFPDAANRSMLAAPEPDINAGGLDVVVSRTAPIKPPFIFRSTRLDSRSTPGNPAKPGKWWEVIIAQHPEQSLSEQNQTIARQLSYRQQIFTLLRQFAYMDWIDKSNELLKAIDDNLPDLPMLAQPGQVYQEIPNGQSEVSPFTGISNGKLEEDSLNALDVPFRLDRFQQGAILLQWEGLPFYYRHRLLAAAQADAVVSEYKEVIQEEFVYIAPQPQASKSGGKGSINVMVNGAPVTPTVEAHLLEIPLRQLWDSLPPDVQYRWQEEAPNRAEFGKIYPSAVPDLAVVYQIIDSAYGNVEVQAELFIDLDKPTFAVRQLGQQVAIGQQVNIVNPTFKTPDERLHLQLIAARRRELPLEDTSQLAGITPSHIQVEADRLIVHGVLTADDKETIFSKLIGKDREAFTRFYRSWDRYQPISMKLAPLPELLEKYIRFQTPAKATILWHGDLSNDQIVQLRNLPGDTAFLTAVDNLIQKIEQEEEARVSLIRGPEQEPLEILGPWLFDNSQWPLEVTWRLEHFKPVEASSHLKLLGENGRYLSLEWEGIMLARHLPQLATSVRQWGAIDELLPAINSLLTIFEDVELIETFQRRPSETEINDEMGAELLALDDDSLTWTGPSAPTAENIAHLHELKGDNAFTTAAGKLADQLNEPISIQLQAPISLPTDLDEKIANQLQTQTTSEGLHLVWLPPFPAQEQIDTIHTLLSQLPQLPFQQIKEFNEAIASARTVSLIPIEQPTNEDVPHSLKSNLKIEGNQIMWTGLVEDIGQLFSFHRFVFEKGTYEPSFSQALQSIYHGLLAMQHSVPVDCPIRPSPDQWDASLQNQLTVAYHQIVYHGIMPIATAQLLEASYLHANDKRSIHSLYEDSQSAGETEHQLQIRALRGSATPSDRILIEPQQLPEGEPNG